MAPTIAGRGKSAFNSMRISLPNENYHTRLSKILKLFFQAIFVGARPVYLRAAPQQRVSRQLVNKRQAPWIMRADNREPAYQAVAGK
jgi:hypothetical protein